MLRRGVETEVDHILIEVGRPSASTTASCWKESEIGLVVNLSVTFCSVGDEGVGGWDSIPLSSERLIWKDCGAGTAKLKPTREVAMASVSILDFMVALRRSRDGEGLEVGKRYQVIAWWFRERWRHRVIACKGRERSGVFI